MLIHVPPLCQRRDDIAPLWEYFTHRHAGSGVSSAPELLHRLAERAWPGNVRELRNLNERLVVLRQRDRLTTDDLERAALPGEVRGATGVNSEASAGPAAEVALDAAGAKLPLGPLPHEGFSLLELEKEVIRRALIRHGGNKSRTAEYLGIPRHVLIYRIGKFGL
jgi:two-component system NtrC family response regulator